MIRGRGAEDPARGNSIRAFVSADRSRQAFGFGSLPMEAPNRRSQVLEAVPDLGDDEHAMEVVAQSDVDRECRVGGPCRQLKPCVNSVFGREAKDKLLRAQVACIAGLRVDGPGEANAERPPDSNSVRDPKTKRRAGAVAEVHLADSRLMDPKPPCQGLLGKSPPFPGPSEIEAESDGNGLCFPIALQPAIRPSAPGASTRWLVAHESESYAQGFIATYAISNGARQAIHRVSARLRMGLLITASSMT